MTSWNGSETVKGSPKKNHRVGTAFFFGTVGLAMVLVVLAALQWSGLQVGEWWGWCLIGLGLAVSLGMGVGLGLLVLRRRSAPPVSSSTPAGEATWKSGPNARWQRPATSAPTQEPVILVQEDDGNPFEGWFR